MLNIRKLHVAAIFFVMFMSLLGGQEFVANYHVANMSLSLIVSKEAMPVQIKSLFIVLKRGDESLESRLNGDARSIVFADAEWRGGDLAKFGSIVFDDFKIKHPDMVTGMIVYVVPAVDGQADHARRKKYSFTFNIDGVKP